MNIKPSYFCITQCLYSNFCIAHCLYLSALLCSLRLRKHTPQVGSFEAWNKWVLYRAALCTCCTPTWCSTFCICCTCCTPGGLLWGLEQVSPKLCRDCSCCNWAPTYSHTCCHTYSQYALCMSIFRCLSLTLPMLCHFRCCWSLSLPMLKFVTAGGLS